MKTCIINTLFVIESLTIVNLLNKVQFPFVKVFPPQMLSSSSEGAIVQAVPIAFAPVLECMGLSVFSTPVKLFKIQSSARVYDSLHFLYLDVVDYFIVHGL